MKHLRTLALVFVALLVLAAGWWIARQVWPGGQADQVVSQQDEPRPTPRPTPSLDVWLIPDYERGGAWVQGWLTRDEGVPAGGYDYFAWDGDPDGDGYYLGWWQDSALVDKGDGAWELQLPGLALPQGESRVRLVSAVFPTGTLLSEAYGLRTYGDYNYLAPRIAAPDPSGPLTATLPFFPIQKEIDLTLTPLLVETVMDETASATGGEVSRYFDGAVRDAGSRLPYKQAGLIGQGRVRLQVHTVEGSTARSDMAFLEAVRTHRVETGEAGSDRWHGAIGRLLERSLDFPSFPTLKQRGRLDRHKETLIQVESTSEISTTVRADASALVLEAPFQLYVWRPKEEDDDSWPSPLAGFRYADGNTFVEGGDEWRLSLGKVLLGPQDLFSVTVNNALWLSVEPEPDAFADRWHQGQQGPVHDGFTLVYRGPRSFYLEVEYRPEAELFAQQSVAMLRGRSRAWEYGLADTVTGWWNELWRWVAWGAESAGLESGHYVGLLALAVVNLGSFALLWILYQHTIPDQQLPRLLGGGRGKGKAGVWRGRAHVVLRSIIILWLLFMILAFVNSEGWTRLTELWRPGSVDPAKWKNLPRPFILPLIAGAWLLLRWDTLRFRRGWALPLVSLTCFVAEVALQLGLYSRRLLNAIKFSGATGTLSGVTSLVLFFLVGMLFWRGWWVDKKGGQPRLRPEDLHALVFAALVFATFEILDTSLLALIVLYGLWLAFSLLLDRVCKGQPVPAGDGSPAQSPVPEPAASADGPAAVADGPPAAAAEPGQLGLRTALLSLGLTRRVLSLWPGDRERAPAPDAEGEPGPAPSERAAPQEAPAVPEAVATKGTVTQEQAGGSCPESLGAKLDRVRHPLFVAAILVVAIILSQDPFLRAQLASFEPAELTWGNWFLQLLDPLAYLATTLVPCMAMVWLTVLGDATFERLQAAGSARALSRAGVYLKSFLLAFFLFLIFMLGIGGLTIFIGAFGLKLSDRIVYYITVPLLTSIWLDLRPPEEGWSAGKLRDALKSGLETANLWLRLALLLLSILAPWLISSATTEQMDQIIQVLQMLQF